jgi:phage protein D
MAATTLSQESNRNAGLWVPQFEVRIEGSGLPHNVVRDILQLTYHDNIKEIDGFDMTVNNWDTTSRDFKYIGSNSESRLFDPCKKVEVLMGYSGRLETMCQGHIKTLEPNFPTAGGPTLSVRGANLLDSFRKKQNTRVWQRKEGVRDSEIALDIGYLADTATGKERVKITISDTAKQAEPLLDYVAQENQYDIDFLLSRARQRGYVITYDEVKKEIYFGPSDRNSTGQSVSYSLEWGKSLVDFKPTLTVSNQVKSVTVHGWNRNTKQKIEEKVSLDDPRFRQNKDIHRVIQDCNPREEVVVDEPVFTPQQARARAFAILSDRAKDAVKATGTTVGLPKLRAGVLVEIAGIGPRFSGQYFVTETNHTMGSGGYTTRFTARREDKGALRAV